jgi:hypothetical protein
MPFSPELQSKVDAMKANLGGGDLSADDELSVLRKKLQQRQGVGGYTANVADLQRRIEELEQ